MEAIFSKYTNEELINFTSEIEGDTISENSELRVISEQMFGSDSLINILMLSVSIAKELGVRLEQFIGREMINNFGITKKNFINLFEYSAEQESNGETIDKIDIETLNDRVIITFDIDAYGVHKNNKIFITNEGAIKLQSSEFLESLSGVEQMLINGLENHISNLN